MADIMIQNQKKEKRLVYVAIIVAVVVILVATAIIALSGDGRKIRKAEAAAKKYLLDLDYDNAILMYDEILKLDPKNVDAYIGLADIYVAKEEYQSALDILNQALSVITNENDILIVTNKIDEVNLIISGGVSAISSGEASTESIGSFVLLGSIDSVEEGRFKHPDFYEYEYPSEVASVLDAFVSLATADQYIEASDYAINTLRPILNGCGSVRGISRHSESKECASVRFIRNGYKLCIEFKKNGGFYYMVTPVESGTGYGYNYNVNSETMTHMSYDTANGRPNGHFHLTDERLSGHVVEYDGYASDGFLDGTLAEDDSQFDWDFTCYYYFEEGFLSKYEKNDAYEFGYYTGFDADGHHRTETNYANADYSPITEFRYLTESEIKRSYTVNEGSITLSY